MPLVGTRVGNYVVTGLLGRGGMGAVYLAEHPEIGRRVAIKVLAPRLVGTPAAAERFVAEARAVTRIDHPNIIYIFDFGRTEDGRLYYAMEALQGRELKAVILARGKLTALEVLPYLEQICAAISAAHGQGVIHRDLKPDNIFVVDGPRLTLKILDFGIAKLLETQAGTHTSTGLLMGTPQYMSPEQASGRPNLIGPGSDIYSLGIMVYQMLTGRVPFSADTPIVTAAMHVGHTPQPLIELEPSLPLAVNALVMQCLAKDPGKRPAGAAELALRFAEAVGETLSVPMPGLSGRSDSASTDSLALGPTLEQSALLAAESSGRMGPPAPSPPALTPPGATTGPPLPSPPSPSTTPALLALSPPGRATGTTGPIAPSPPGDTTGPLAATIVSFDPPAVRHDPHATGAPVAPGLGAASKALARRSVLVTLLLVGAGAAAWGVHAWRDTENTRAAATPDVRADRVAQTAHDRVPMGRSRALAAGTRVQKPNASDPPMRSPRRDRDGGADGSQPVVRRHLTADAAPTVRRRRSSTRRGRSRHPSGRPPATQRVRRLRRRDWGEVRGGPVKRRDWGEVQGGL